MATKQISDLDSASSVTTTDVLVVEQDGVTQKATVAAVVAAGISAAAHEHTASDIASESAADGYVLTADGAGGAAWEAASGGSIGGSTGSTDNAILRADGTGGSTVQAAAPTIDDSGNLAMADAQIQRAEIKDYAEAVNAIGSIGGGSQDIDLESGNVVTATVDTSETTFTFSNPPASGKAGSFTLLLTNGGSQTVNWPATVKWAGGTAPALTAAGVDILTFLTLDAGTTWYGFLAGLDFS